MIIEVICTNLAIVWGPHIVDHGKHDSTTPCLINLAVGDELI